MEDKSTMGQYEGNFRSHYSIGIIIIVAHYQSAVKYAIQKQPFNMCVRKKMDFSGRCFILFC